MIEDFSKPEAAISKAVDTGIEAMVVVGIERETNAVAIQLAEKFHSIWATVGWHPNHASDYTSQELTTLREQLAHPRVVAIGEIGLDNHWDHATPEQQEQCLFDQLDLADELQKPVVFHCREAYPRLLALLEKHAPKRFMLHCFAGTKEDAERAERLGGYFGFDGPITYKKNHELREIARQVPLDRILTETDSPFLSPEPLRGKPNEPANLIWVIRGLAAARQIDEDECRRITTQNARDFFGINP
jgi:TatD DNase family protein